jgi:hypothetical protein
VVGGSCARDVRPQIIRTTNCSVVHWSTREGWPSVLEPAANKDLTVDVSPGALSRITVLSPPLKSEGSDPRDTADTVGLMTALKTVRDSGTLLVDLLLLESVDEASVVAQLVSSDVSVCQVAFKSSALRRVETEEWYPSLLARGFALMHEEESGHESRGSSAALFLSHRHCNPEWLRIATQLPSLTPEVGAPLYRTAVVIGVEDGTAAHFVHHLVDQCVHFLRQPLSVILVVSVEALALGGAQSGLLNLRRAYAGVVTIVSVPGSSVASVAGDWEATAWNAGVQAAQSLSPDVVLVLNPAAILGHHIVHMTDAVVAGSTSGSGGMGPYFPLTNAPRRGGLSSPQLSLPSAFETSAAPAQSPPQPKVQSLPANGETVQGLGGRVWAFSPATLAAGPHASGGAPFQTSGAPFCSDLAWLRSWAEVPGRSVHIVHSCYVMFESLLDVGTEPFPPLSDMLMPV